MASDDLDLAWRRLKLDYGDRSFVTHPFLLDCVEKNIEYWLRTIKAALEADWAPKAAKPCFRPKPSHMLRPGPVLSWQDELAYNYLLQRFLPNIWTRIGWSQGKVDLAYELRDPSTRTAECVHRGARVWKEWREKSLALLVPGVTHVVTSDLAGFYENIDHPLLLSELASCNVDGKEHGYLRSALRRWSSPRGKGIPQGYTSSDILAKLYLEPLDSALVGAGYQHLRYVDDIRIFCTSHTQARRAIQQLTELVAARGLNLQSAKTKILTAEEATAEIRGVQTTLSEVQNKLSDELLANPYASLAEVFAALKTSDTPSEVLERAFSEKLATESARFDATLFHFLMYRLGAAKSRIAIGYCLNLLSEHPEETDAVLRYLAEITPMASELDQIASYMTSEGAIYDYQLFELLRWFFQGQRYHPAVVALARTWAFDKNRSDWLRSYAVAYLGEHGMPSDLNLLHSAYGGLLDELERATYVLSLVKLEKSRRNAFFVEVRGDGELVRAAAELAKVKGASGGSAPP
jgi:hypothetical protein